MEDRIQDLIQEVYEQKELKQRAELKQLQEQINPHFLYNSLFSIRSKTKALRSSQSFWAGISGILREMPRIM